MIRPATEADLPALLALAAAMRAEAPLFRDRPWRPERVEAVLRACAERGALLVAHGEGQPIGFAACTVEESAWFGDLVAAEQALYVAPAWRSSRAAVAMVREMERLAAAAGAGWLDAGDHSGNGLAGRLYRALGFTEVGRSYRKALANDP